MNTMRSEALDALRAKGMAEQQLARIATCPPWRHAAFAGLMAALTLSPALPVALRFAVLACVLGAIVLIVRSDKRRLGVFINGYRRGRTRLVALPLLVVCLGLYTLSCYVGLDGEHPEICVGLAALTFVVAYLGSVLWQRVFVRELGA